MLMGRPTMKEASKFKDVLEDFIETLGIEINLHKPKIFLFNAPPIVKGHIPNSLAKNVENIPTKYLRAPPPTNSIKTKSFTDFIQ